MSLLPAYSSPSIHPRALPALVLSILFGSMLGGCSSLWQQRSAQQESTPSAPTLQTLPPAMAARNVYIPGENWHYELDELAGAVVVRYASPMDGKEWAITRQITTPNVPLQKLGVMRGLHFGGVVNDQAGADLRAFLSAAGTLPDQHDTLLQVQYSDLRRIALNQEEWNARALGEEANRPKDPKIAAKYYVVGVTLGVVHRQVLEPAGHHHAPSTSPQWLMGKKRYQQTAPTRSDLVISLDLMPMGAFATPEKEAGSDQAVQGLRIRL